jgi:hypothetical protein
MRPLPKMHGALSSGEAPDFSLEATHR